jgi:hypothetical protein
MTKRLLQAIFALLSGTGISVMECGDDASISTIDRS